MRIRFAAVVLLVAVVVVSSPTSSRELPGVAGEWWNVPYPGTYQAGTNDHTLSFIRVEGNRFVDDQGRTMVFRGVNISDPDKLAKMGHWNRRHFEVIKEWGANVVRVPVHPVAWKERGREEYFKLLDQAVDWASELGLYLIVEWHSIGNLETGLFQHPMHQTTKQETFEFWRGIAHRYAGVSTIAFYELFNEPTLYRGQLGRMTWTQWKEINEEIIHIIFAHNPKVIPLVAGFDWAYELRGVRDEPIAIPGVGYVSHPYPMKAPRPWEESWERDFGYVADTYPLFATEIGFMAAGDPGAHNPVISDVEYGKAVISYFDKKGISWTAWCFDPDWPPQLISDWSYTPTVQGAFFRGVMLNAK
jgi:endoglucanase